MPIYSTTLYLRELQKQTESFLDIAISQWQMTPHSVFARKPSATGWSANECLQHLNSYSRYYLPAMEKAIAAESKPSSPLFHSGWLGNYFTRSMLPAANGAVKKMKAPKDHTPTSIVASHTVISEFIDHQEKLLVLLEAASRIDINHAKVPISIATWIKLKLGDVFGFVVAHEYRHFLQAQKALGLEMPEPFSIAGKAV